MKKNCKTILVIQLLKFHVLFVVYLVFDRPDSSVGRVSAFGAGGHGFESRPHHTKGVKNGTSSSLADAHIKGVVLGR